MLVAQKYSFSVQIKFGTWYIGFLWSKVEIHLLSHFCYCSLTQFFLNQLLMFKTHSNLTKSGFLGNLEAYFHDSAELISITFAQLNISTLASVKFQQFLKPLHQFFYSAYYSLETHKSCFYLNFGSLFSALDSLCTKSFWFTSYFLVSVSPFRPAIVLCNPLLQQTFSLSIAFSNLVSSLHSCSKSIIFASLCSLADYLYQFLAYAPQYFHLLA